MQKVITYIKKVKLVNPLTLFKNWLLTNHYKLLTDLMAETKRLDDRIDCLENQTNIDDVENRVENLEYDLEARIESAEDRSETNQESINIIKNKLEEFHTNYQKMCDDLGKRLLEDFGIIKDRFKQARKKILSIVDRVENVESRLENETADIYDIKTGKEIREIIEEVLCDKGLSLNKLDERVFKIEAEQLLKAPEYDDGKQEKTEASLSAMQKLSFEICKYYGGDFNLDDFNNCYDIINKYDVKEVK